jgi:glucose 1-dehydrogenase
MSATPRTSLQDQVAIVTGASSGLGRATALALAQEGATVVANHPPTSASRDKAAAVIAEVEAAGGSAIAIEADVAKEDQVEAMIAKTVRRFGTIHMLIANAGIERPAPIQHMSLEDWQPCST